MPRLESYLLVGHSHVLRVPQKDFVNMFIAKMRLRMSLNVMGYSVPIALVHGATFTDGASALAVGILITLPDVCGSLVASPL